MDKLVEYGGRKRRNRPYSSNVYRTPRVPSYRGKYGLNYRPRSYSPRPIPNGYSTENSVQERYRPSQASPQVSRGTESAVIETLRPEKDAEELLKELEADPRNQQLLELVLERMDKEFEELRQQLEREALERSEQLLDNDPPLESADHLSERTAKQLVESAVADALKDIQAEGQVNQIPDAGPRVDNSRWESDQREIRATQPENSELENLIQELERVDFNESSQQEKEQRIEKKGLEIEAEDEASLEVVEEDAPPPEAQSY